jgi:hypothetical protein
VTNYELALIERIRILGAHNRRLRTWWPVVAVACLLAGYLLRPIMEGM